MSDFRSNYLSRLGIGPAGFNPSRRGSDDLSIGKSAEGESAAPVTGPDHPHSSEFTMQFLNQHSQDDFRIQYLKKLSYAGVWVPQAAKPPKHQTAIIFDYDDTLIPSVYLNHRPDGLAKPEVKKHLETIATHGAALLELAAKFGHVFIITNAIHGWVFYSAEKYLPSLLPTLKKVKVISARDSFEHQYPGQYHEWKVQAFLKVQKELNQQVITNLISLGDSMIEHDAVHVMGAEFSEALVKTIKFRDTPTPEELAKQLELVLAKFEKIALNARNLKISLERKWTPGNSDAKPSPS